MVRVGCLLLSKGLEGLTISAGGRQFWIVTRIVLYILVSCLVWSAGVFGHSSGIRQMEYEYLEDVGFRRIWEYFTGREYAGGDIILRSNPECRSGLYFVFEVDGECLGGRECAYVELRYRKLGDMEMHVEGQVVNAFGRGWQRVLYGLTGVGENQVVPIAWSIRVLSEARDETLASAGSYLWAEECVE